MENLMHQAASQTHQPLDLEHETHEVFNQPYPLENYNLFSSDQALREAVERDGAQWAWQDLEVFGNHCGKPEIILAGTQANENKPVLKTHDRYGRRIDEVEFHPAYHQLMQTAIQEGLHSSPWVKPKPGAQVARAAKYYLNAQVEAGHGCPITMTFAPYPRCVNNPSSHPAGNP